MVHLTLILFVMASCFSIASYNSQGSGVGRLPYIETLCSETDFVFIQEHWLFSEQLSRYSDTIPGINVHGMSGMNESELLTGRPFGGCAILWKRSLTCQVTPVTVSSRRLCAVTVNMDSVTLLLCNVYMPGDTMNDQSNLEEYTDTLGEVTTLGANLNADHIIVGGDFNTDPKRLGSLHTTALQRFMTSEDMCNGLYHASSQVDFTFESKASGARSTIDHFLITENLFSLVTDYHVHHSGDNLSDHSPLYMTMNIPATHTGENSETSFSTKLNWNSASPEDLLKYAAAIDAKLDSIVMPWEALHCTDHFCSIHDHQIERFHNDIIGVCLDASRQSIPMCGQKQKSRGMPGWNDHVEEKRQRAIFWHNLWKENNSPREGILADIRRNTRAEYHLALRHIRGTETKSQQTSLLALWQRAVLMTSGLTSDGSVAPRALYQARWTGHKARTTLQTSSVLSIRMSTTVCHMTLTTWIV